VEEIHRTYIRTYAFVLRIRYPFRSHYLCSVEYIGSLHEQRILPKTGSKSLISVGMPKRRGLYYITIGT
jgi:hypothetical protein